MEKRKISKNFYRSEFACECGCGFDTIDAELVMVLEDTRSYFGKEYKLPVCIIITGGNRCQKHNEEVQRHYNPNYIPYTSKSYHMLAMASDFKVFVKITNIWKQVPADNVSRYLEDKYPDRYGIGRYKNRTHVDVRKKKVRWDKR